jgi:hypothetical protein
MGASGDVAAETARRTGAANASPRGSKASKRIFLISAGLASCRYEGVAGLIDGLAEGALRRFFVRLQLAVRLL